MYVLMNNKGDIIHTTKIMSEVETLVKFGHKPYQIDTDDEKYAGIVARIRFFENNNYGEWVTLH
jgi:hypothetical protein